MSSRKAPLSFISGDISGWSSLSVILQSTTGAVLKRVSDLFLLPQYQMTSVISAVKRKFRTEDLEVFVFINQLICHLISPPNIAHSSGFCDYLVLNTFSLANIENTHRFVPTLIPGIGLRRYYTTC